MSGRPATKEVIAGKGAISVGAPGSALPSGWKWVKLTKVARLESGHTPSRRHPEYWDGPIPWLGIKDARAHHAGVITDTRQSITQAGLENSAARLLPAQTVCLSRTASVGYVIILGRPMATSQDFVNWVCSDALEPKYLMYALINEGRDGLMKFGRGTVHTTIYYPAVKAFHIALPPLDEQQRIVHRLDELLERCERIEAELAKVPPLFQKLRHILRSDAYQGRLTEDWRDAHCGDTPAADSLLEDIESGRRKKWNDQSSTRGKYPSPISPAAEYCSEIPSTWTWTTLQAITDPTRPVQYGILKPGPHQPDGIPYVKVRDMRGDVIQTEGLNRTTKEIHSKYVRSALAGGDLLVSIRGTYGGVAMVPDELDGANITQDSARVAPMPGVDRRYLRVVLQAPQTQRFFEEIATGVAVRGLNIRDLRQTPIPLAPPNEQTEIVDRLEGRYEGALKQLEARCGDALPEVGRVRQMVLSRAFDGTLVEHSTGGLSVAELVSRAKIPEASRTPRAKGKKRRTGRRAGATMSTRKIEEILSQMPSEFSFDELRARLPGSYEELQSALFSLLQQKDAPVIQVYDKNERRMKLRRISP